MNSKAKSRGFALLEIVLAFGVSLVMIVGMISLGVTVVRATTLNKSYAEAGKIAQREVERLKLLRTTLGDWETFKNAVSCEGAGAKCHLSVSGNSFSVISGVGSSGTDPFKVDYFFHTDTSTSAAGDRVDYTVETTWEVGEAAKTYIIEGVFTNWGENE